MNDSANWTKLLQKWSYGCYIVIAVLAIQGLLYDLQAFTKTSTISDRVQIPDLSIQEPQVSPEAITIEKKEEAIEQGEEPEEETIDRSKYPWSRTCIFIQSFGIDRPGGQNYTHQRVMVARTWASSVPDGAKVIFVTDGWSPPGFENIALNTTHFNYNDGPIVLFMLIAYIQKNMPNCDFYQFTDSDAYVYLPNNLKALSHRDPEECLYLGYLIQERKWQSLAAHGTLITISRRFLNLIDTDFCIAHHPWGYFDIRLGNCVESLMDDKNIAHRDGSELSDSNFVRQTGDDLPEKWEELQKTDLSCLIAIHKAKEEWLMQSIHDHMTKAEECKRPKPHYKPTYECGLADQAEKSWKIYWDLKKLTVDTVRDTGDFKKRFEGQNVRINDNKAKLENQLQLISGLQSKVDALIKKAMPPQPENVPPPPVAQSASEPNVAEEGEADPSIPKDQSLTDVNALSVDNPNGS